MTSAVTELPGSTSPLGGSISVTLADTETASSNITAVAANPNVSRPGVLTIPLFQDRSNTTLDVDKTRLLLEFAGQIQTRDQADSQPEQQVPPHP